jgi:2-amino-4-hydroxy-6-hydroxymethyldihydropteridine diphosphokinase
MTTVRAYIGLGANVGSAKATLTAAVHALAALPGASLAGVSRLYVTTPVEVADQPDFHNAVVALDVPAGPGGLGATGPIALLLALKSIERAFGRQDRFRYGPRELDLDLLLFGEERIVVERPEEGRSPDPAKATRLLEVPHPEAGRRLFVLAPLSDLAPRVGRAGPRPPGIDRGRLGRSRRRRLGLGLGGVGGTRVVDPLRIGGRGVLAEFP